MQRVRLKWGARNFSGINLHGFIVWVIPQYQLPVWEQNGKPRVGVLPDEHCGRIKLQEIEGERMAWMIHQKIEEA